jgi:tetratricopeptide (TPR) repeat protein
VGTRPIEQSNIFVLLLTDRVQDELQLDEAQRERIRKLPAAVRARHKKQRDELLQQIKETQEKSAKAQQEYYKAVDDAVARVLKPEQVKRLRQIEVQSQGLAAFEDRAVAAALKLTDGQKKDYVKIVADLSKAQAELAAKEKRLTNQDAAKLTQKALTAMIATLTDEQKAVLKGLVGEPSPAAGSRFPLGAGGPVGDYYRHLLRVNLLLYPKLAEELKLGDEQTEALKTAVKEAQAKVQKATTPAGDVPLQVLLSRLEQKMIDEARTEAEGEVLKPEQKRRLEELLLQARGLTAFEDLAVLKALKLTPEQARAVEDASKGIARKRQEFAKELGKTKATLPEMLERLGKQEGVLHQEAVAGIVKGLDESQKQAWQKLTGKEFDYPKAGVVPPAAEVFPARAYFNEATAAYFRSEFDKALTGFDESLNLDPEYAPSCNSKAWLLATCPEEKYRDGLEAIRLAKKACARTQDKVASYLDTLAAAYAEAGEFEQAVQTQMRALQIAAPQERAEFAARLKLFRENKKYRETPAPGQGMP